ncbi:MAG: ABC transporter substrate-binding protein [Infirmifilum sp.]|jgi:iron(III) transport system substrate-binding protein|uniref:ABC transporter substrate-binding protein n=1 Tax=Infirmifilum sp. TaxID=2856575 RepID=UPI003D0A9A51
MPQKTITLRKTFAVFLTLIFLSTYSSLILQRVLAAPELEDRLVLIGPVYKQEAESVIRGFKDYVKREFGKDIQVDYLSPGGWPVCVDRVRAWRGKPDADIFFGGGAPAYEVLKAEGLAEKYVPKTANNLPDKAFGTNVKDPEGYWYAFSLWFITIIYNAKVLKQLNIPPPKTWDDLLNPIYRDKLVYTIPYASGTMHEMIELLISYKGYNQTWAYLRRLAVNTARYSTGSTDTLLIVERGEVPIGLAQPQMNAMMAQADGYDVVAVIPEATLLVAEGVMMLKNAPHPNLARLFMDWILSEEGQKYVLAGGYFPAMKDFHYSNYINEIKMAQFAIKALGGADSFYDIKGVTAVQYDGKTAVARWDQINNMYESEIYRKLDEIKTTWKLLEQVRDEVSLQKSKGVDVRAAETKLNEAFSLFDTGKLAEARLAAESARQMLVAGPTPSQAPLSYELLLLGAAIAILAAAAYLYYKSRKKLT